MDRQRGRKSVDNLWDDSLIDIENPRKHRSICLLDCKKETERHIFKRAVREASVTGICNGRLICVMLAIRRRTEVI